jgi:anhydro-N-acetylmuramic acid kinase
MKTTYAIGLMSGTSLDGLDAVLIHAHAKGKGFHAHTVAHVHAPFPKKWSEKVREISSRNQLREGFYLGRAWSEFAAGTVRRLLQKARVPASQVSVIGAHGQTVVHEPKNGVSIQLADLSRLAIRSRVPVVGNFRMADLAVGGQGAPLAPHAHRLLFGHPQKTIAVQNLGGIGNVTLLKKGRVVLAYDTGPANVWIDTIARMKSDGKLLYDRNGSLASKGKADHKLVMRLLQHPYFRLRPPKSAGWEQFGPQSLKGVERQLKKMRTADALATVSEATARATAESYRRYAYPKGIPSRIVLCGGGAKNRFVMKRLEQLLPEAEIETSESWGIGVDQVEAVAFALLALQTLRGNPSNEPAATGARRPVICGQLAFP